MKNQLLKKSPSAGISLIATVLTLMIFALFIAIAVSLVTTGSNIGLQEEQGMQALFVADGGLEYTVKRNNFPNYAISPAVNLGRGSFTVSIPTLSANITAAATTINVSSTEGFIFNPGDPTRYWIMLCDTATNPIPNLNTYSNCEKISFTGITATTFTGGVRGRDSSTAATHLQNTVLLMYSWKIANPLPTTLNGAHTAATTTITVNSTAGFAPPPAFIRINNATENNREDVLYKGITATTFTGCIRGAYDGGIGIAKSNGATVWQSEITVLPLSTGIIPGNPLTGDIQRKIQLSVAPLK
jgi:hypothetical protein